MSDMLTLEKFEEASEIVKKVTSETKLIYSEYLSLSLIHISEPTRLL